MDDREKKLLPQLDDPMPGQRGNALEQLHDYDEKHKTSFRDRVAKIERGEQYDVLEQEAVTLRQQLVALDGELAQYQAAIATWEKAYDDQGAKLMATKAKLAVASTIAWGRTRGAKLAAYIAMPLIAVGVWQASVRYWPLPDRVDASLREIAATTSWSDGCSNAVVREVGSAPYWVMLCGRTDTTSDMNAQGQPIGLHCLDLYATTAKADWQEYVKADPYALFGWWINWPKRAVHCDPFEIKEAQR
jgi:hypothetical protein